jgi:hypothetical protein
MSQFNKAIAGVLTPLIMQAILAGLVYSGITISAADSAAITSLVTGLVVYAVPNITQKIETIVEYVPDEEAKA